MVKMSDIFRPGDRIAVCGQSYTTSTAPFVQTRDEDSDNLVLADAETDGQGQHITWCETQPDVCAAITAILHEIAHATVGKFEFKVDHTSTIGITEMQAQAIRPFLARLGRLAEKEDEERQAERQR